MARATTEVTFAASVKFIQDLTAWRRTRPEYADLCKAVKRHAKAHAGTDEINYSTDEMRTLAAEAGLSLVELLHLTELAARAVRAVKWLGVLPKAQKELDALEADIKRIVEQRAVAGVEEHRQLSKELKQLTTQKMHFMRDRYLPAKNAASMLEQAKLAGVA